MNTSVSVAALLSTNSSIASKPLAEPVAPARNQGQPAPAKASQGLAASILADGGLGFLQARLQEKMVEHFGAAGAPEAGATAGPAAAVDAGRAVSPEATADRIVGFALSLRGVYDRINAGMSPEELRSGFETEIRRGISDGFDHAKGVLSGLNLLEGQTRDNVDTTWELVQQKLKEHFLPRQED